MAADQRRPLRLAYAVAGRLVQDPEGVLAVARTNLEQMQGRYTRGRTASWLRQWEDLLAGPVDELLDVLTSPSPRARELRQNAPFAGVLTEDERAAVLRSTR